MMIGKASSGRMMAVYQRPCSAMMIADASFRAAISASISLAARSAAMRSCVLAASSFALYALIRPLMTGPPIRLASQVHMALPSLACFGRIGQLLLVAFVSQVSEELEQRSCPDQDERPSP